MRILLYILLLASLFFAPVDRLDIADLEPVQAVALYTENGTVVLETDTEDRGSGATATEALRNMKQNTASVIYLDTAEFLLVAEDAKSHVEELRQYLKSSVKVAPYNGGSVREEAKYADVHGNPPRLRDWQMESPTEKAEKI